MKGRPCKRCNGNGAVADDGSALPPDCDENLFINICFRCDGSGEHKSRCDSRSMHGRECERPLGHNPGHRITGWGACVWYDLVTELQLDADEKAKGAQG